MLHALVELFNFFQISSMSKACIIVNDNQLFYSNFLSINNSYNFYNYKISSDLREKLNHLYIQNSLLKLHHYQNTHLKSSTEIVNNLHQKIYSLNYNHDREILNLKNEILNLTNSHQDEILNLKNEILNLTNSHQSELLDSKNEINSLKNFHEGEIINLTNSFQNEIDSLKNIH